MSKIQETVLEIDLNALKHNLAYIKSKIKNNTKILAVVKAFGYGTDAVKVAKYLEQLKIDYFAVAYVKEGEALRDSGIKTPILVLHPQPVNFELLIDKSLEPNLYNARVLIDFLKIAKKKKLNDYPIHIKFNTGLNRLGFSKKDIDHIINSLANA
ncbi:MAG: alanine racemase, partial [Aureibaculum sp.]|nr:alanine racemase [Aureibaculum sp.]